MTTVYIQIGMQKTGTTAIQTFMRENAEELKKQDCCYPFMDLGIASKYNDRNAQFLVYRELGLEGEEARRREKEVRETAYCILEKLAKEYSKIILSDELIWHRALKIPDFWKKMKKSFAEINCQVKVIVYLRRQDLFIQSLWNQSVKAMPRLDKTFRECIEKDYFKYYPLDYYKQLMEIADDLGKENIIVRVYERGQFQGEEHSIFSDFMEAVGLQLTSSFLRENVFANDRIDGNFIEIKRILNEIPEYQTMDDFLRNPVWMASAFCAGKEPEKKTGMFSYEEQTAYLAKFAQSNRRVAQEFLGRTDGCLFYEEIQRVEQWKPDETKMYRDLLVLMCEGFCEQERKIDSLKNEIKLLKSEMADRRTEIKEVRNSLIFRGYRKVRRIIKGE